MYISFRSNSIFKHLAKCFSIVNLGIRSFKGLFSVICFVYVYTCMFYIFAISPPYFNSDELKIHTCSKIVCWIRKFTLLSSWKQYVILIGRTAAQLNRIFFEWTESSGRKMICFYFQRMCISGWHFKRTWYNI